MQAQRSVGNGWKAAIEQLSVLSMTDDSMTFAEWVPFEANRIVELGLAVSNEHRADYMRVQIEAALRKVAAHFRDGLGSDDPPRAEH
jgi:hypothetical protein